MNVALDASIETQVADIKACLDAMEGHAKAGNSEGMLFFAERIAETARYIESMVSSGPVEGCDDCAWYTDAFEQPTACPECEADQREEKKNG